MRKLIVSNMVSIDGYFAGPNGEVDWHKVDKEVSEYAIDMLNSADALLFGRVTYELMASFWPTDIAAKNDPIVAHKMNTLSKIVFSKTLPSVEWNNTQLIRENIGEEVLQLKQQNGKDILILGSGSIVSEFTRLDLIDEYRVIVNPVVLGNGKSQFAGVNKKLDFKHINTRTFLNGNTVLYYTPVRQ